MCADTSFEQLYRCLVIFRFKLYLLIPLVLLFLANMGDRSPLSVISEFFADLQLRETVSSIFFLYESMQPGSSLYSDNTVDWGLARMILTAALNIILAILITGRLLFFRRRLRRALGTSEALAVPYISIAAMVIESSMICAASYLALAIPYALNSHVANIFLPSSFLMPVCRVVVCLKFFLASVLILFILGFIYHPHQHASCIAPCVGLADDDSNALRLDKSPKSSLVHGVHGRDR